MKQYTTIGLAIAGMLSAPAYAQSISSASLSNFQIQLIDLDLTDGITPSITPYSASSYTHSYVNNSIGDFHDAADSDPNNFRAMSANTTNDVAQSNASISGTDFSTAAFNASGNAAGLGGTYFGISSAYVYFTLSANTTAIFTADASIFGNAIIPDSSGEYASAYALLNAGIGAVTSADYIYEIAYCNDTNCVATSYSQSKKLSATITNPFAEAISAYSFSQTDAYGSSYATPSAVPVPAALPLMASALGLFGVAKRRKQYLA